MCLKHCLIYLGIEDAEESDNDADGEKNEAPHSTPLVSSFFILFVVTDYMKCLSIVAPHISLNLWFVICMCAGACMHFLTLLNQYYTLLKYAWLNNQMPILIHCKKKKNTSLTSQRSGHIMHVWKCIFLPIMTVLVNILKR